LPVELITTLGVNDGGTANVGAAGTTGGTVNSFVQGVDTAMVYMPSIAGTYTLY